MAINILLVDDHTILRQGIRFLLELQGDMTICGEAGSGEEALELIGERKPAVVVLDLALPGIDGIAVVKGSKERSPHSKVLLLTQYEDKEYVLPALQAGADGYVLKRCAADELVTAIRQVHGGGKYFSPEILSVMVEGLQGKEDSKADEGLSEREKEVLTFLAQGLTVKEAAKRLYLSPKTVEYHRANAFRKLGFENRADMVRYAIKQGWIS